VGSVDLSSGLNLGASFTNVPGGTANWTFTGGTNYNDDSGTAAIAITKAAASIVVTRYSVIYDGAAHTATGTATGVKGESLTGLSLSATTHTNAGTYSADYWTFSGGTNYNDIAAQTITDTIAKATADCAAISGYSGAYDAGTHGATGSCTGVDALGAATGSSLTLGSSFKDYPGGTAHWVFTGGTNYGDQNGDVAITIAKAQLTVTAGSVSNSSNTFTVNPATALNGLTVAHVNNQTAGGGFNLVVTAFVVAVRG